MTLRNKAVTFVNALSLESLHLRIERFRLQFGRVTRMFQEILEGDSCWLYRRESAVQSTKDQMVQSTKDQIASPSRFGSVMCGASRTTISGIFGNREVFRVLIGLLSRDTSQNKVVMKLMTQCRAVVSIALNQPPRRNTQTGGNCSQSNKCLPHKCPPREWDKLFLSFSQCTA